MVRIVCRDNYPPTGRLPGGELEDPMKKWMSRRPETVADWLFLIAAGVAVYFLFIHLPDIGSGIGMVLGILSPFAGAIVLAYLLDMPTRFFARKLFKGKRGPAIVLSYLCAILAIVILVSLVVPQLVASISMFTNNLDSYVANLQQLLTMLQEDYNLPMDTLSELLANSTSNFERIMDTIADAMPTVASYAANAMSSVVAVFTAVAGSIYMLASKDSLLHNLRAAIFAALPPRAAKSVLGVFSMANNIFSSYIGGQMMDALLVGVETFVLMTVFRLNFAPLISVLVGVTNVIPIFGPFIGAVPSAIILLFADPIQAVWFVILILVVQQIDGNFIAPRIVGNAIGLSGLWVLMAIMLGGDLFGLPGMVIGVPLFGVIYALLRDCVDSGLKSRGIDAQGNPLPPDDPPAADMGTK